MPEAESIKSWDGKLMLFVAVVIQLPLFLLLHIQLEWKVGVAALAAYLVPASVAALAFYIRHRGIRISLRQFLIGLTLGILLFGTVGMRVLNSHIQRQAVAQLTGANASVYYDYDYDSQGFRVLKGSAPSGWFVEFFGVDCFHDVVVVNMQSGNSTDLQFEQLTKLRTCNTLTLRNNVSVTEVAFAHLSRIPGLKRLAAETNAITDSHLVPLARAKNITSLDLSYCPKVTDEGLKCFKSMPQLESLTIGSGQVTSAGLANLVELKQLKRLHLGGPAIDDRAVQHLLELVSLERLDLSLTSVTDQGVGKLAKLSTLQSVSLVHTNISDAGISKLVALPRLRQLNLAGTKLTDEGLEHLTNCSELEQLNVRDTGVTEKGLAVFRSALPDCRLD